MPYPIDVTWPRSGASGCLPVRETSVQEAAAALRRRGQAFAALVSAAGRPDQGRRSLLASGLSPLAIELPNVASLVGRARHGARSTLRQRLRQASKAAFANGAKGILALVSHEGAQLFDDFETHDPWLGLPGLQLWAADEIQQFAAGEPWLSQGVASLDIKPAWDATRHADALFALQRAISAGDLYQACLTYPIETNLPADTARLFAHWLRVQPVDHAAWIHLPHGPLPEGHPPEGHPHEGQLLEGPTDNDTGRGDDIGLLAESDRGGLELLCCSPERFFSLSGDKIRVQPMKGTRAIPHGVSERAQRDIAQALASSVKDRAENIMIVDLMRNDLGRICRAGSVQVESLCHVDTYASVAQMTSTVTGQLRAGADVWDVLAACFPPGSMTGAPKIEASRWIRQLESGPRGLYGGAVGWIEPSGDVEFNVVIRSLQCYRGQARWDVGGGIVADSTAADEWEETRAKAALLSG